MPRYVRLPENEIIPEKTVDLYFPIALMLDLQADVVNIRIIKGKEELTNVTKQSGLRQQVPTPAVATLFENCPNIQTFKDRIYALVEAYTGGTEENIDKPIN